MRSDFSLKTVVVVLTGEKRREKQPAACHVMYSSAIIVRLFTDKKGETINKRTKPTLLVNLGADKTTLLLIPERVF